MSAIFLKIINMNISAVWLILVVLIFRLIFKNAPKWLHVLSWGLVGIRLLCPYFIESSFSMIPTTQAISDQILYESQFEIQTGITSIDHRVNEYLDDYYFKGISVPAYNGIRTMNILMYIWILGSIVIFSYTMIGCWRLYRQIYTAVLLQDNIYQSEKIISPFVFGILKPKIYIPFQIDAQSMEQIIAHEQAHIRRKDHWWKPLGFLLLTIHWFNPLLWISYVLLCRDIELACDEKVIKGLDGWQRADYSKALLDYSIRSSKITACPLAFGENGIKRRIKNILNYKKPACGVITAAIIVCVITAVCFLTNPASAADQNIMTPAIADVKGVFDSYLYVPLHGATYRYEQFDMDTKGVTKDRLLDQFIEESDPENVSWKVYSLQEYPDYSVVLARAGTDYESLYQYSPSKRSAPNELQLAKDHGHVVIEDSVVTSGKKKWQDFVNAAKAGHPSSVKVSHYYTLDPEKCSEQYYEVYQEDYPVIYNQDLIYDGNCYILRWNERDQEYSRKYQYLMHYEKDKISPDAEYNSFIWYVLTNDNTVTWEELQWGLISSQLGDYIDHFTIYTDAK